MIRLSSLITENYVRDSKEQKSNLLYSWLDLNQDTLGLVPAPLLGNCVTSSPSLNL